MKDPSNLKPQHSVLSTQSHQAVLFIGFGGPEKREDIRPFLERVTQGRGIPPERMAEVAQHYERIGGASPINTITQRQADGLRAALAKTDTPWSVYVGNRNWRPFLEDTLRRMAADGVKRAIGFVTAAYRCEASWERYLNAVERARERAGERAPTIDYVSPWFDHPLFIEAICDRIKSVIPRGHWRGIRQTTGGRRSCGVHGSPTEALGDDGMTWIFTAHSIPIPMAEASRYVQELTKTAELVAQKFGQKRWSLAYTSRSGLPEEPWLEPDACDAIRKEAAHGRKEILIIPIGFIADHVEVLFDLDVEAKDAAQKAGVKLLRAQTVGDHPLFLQMMADVIRKTAEACVPHP